jgi:peptide/nickel transport system substrate-binding protein
MATRIKDPQLESLVKSAKTGRLTRREFLGAAAALGVSATLAGALMNEAEATPKRGGHFRIGASDGNTTDSMDPATFESNFQILVAYNASGWLTETAPDNSLKPELAESWEASKDAATWTFKIRKGVEFHNGKTLDAMDVVNTINYHRGENSKSAGKSLLKSITDIKADGNNTVVVTLNSGSSDFPYVLNDYHFNILPSKDGQVMWKGGVGCGCYVVENFEPGVSAKLKRFPNFWRDDRGFFDEVSITSVTDVTARTNALVTNQLDLIDDADLKTLHLVAKNPDVEVENVSSGAHITFPMHVDVSPYDNNDVRLALKYAFPREQVLKKLLRGYGSLGNDHPIGPNLPYHADIEQRDYDLDRAKFHLKKAGLSSVKVNLSASNVSFPGGVDAAILFKEAAAGANIDVNVIREPDDGYWSSVWLKKPFCLASWGQRPTPDVMFSLGYAAGAAWNDSHFSDERFNKLLIQARAELNEKLRTDMYREMQEIVRDKGGTIVPFFRNWVFLRRSNVKHSGSLSGNWPMDGDKAPERWWFA